MDDRVEQGLREQVDGYLAATTSPRHRAMIENFTDFIIAEFAADKPRVQASFTPDAELHNYGFEPELHLIGGEAIAEFYGERGSQFELAEWSLEQLIVGDAGLAGLALMTGVTKGELLKAADRPLPEDSTDEPGSALYRVAVHVAFFRRFEGDLASEWVVIPGHGKIERFHQANG